MLVWCAFDYRTFFKRLLGLGWFMFEIDYVLLMFIILAVMGAAAGEIAFNLLGVPKLAGSLFMIAAIGGVLLFGTAAIERFLVLGVGYLYLVYVVFAVWCMVVFGGRIGAHFAQVPVGDGWIQSGVRYAGYNLAIIPAVLFCVRHLTRRREALAAGALAGPLGMLPGVVFYLAMMGWYDEIADVALPSGFLLAKLHAPWFEWAFQLAVMLTLVDTGETLLHAINERVANAFTERRQRPMPRALRPVLAVGVMLLAVYVVPLMSLGLWRLWQHSKMEHS